MPRPIHARYNIGFLRERRSFRTIFINPKFSAGPEVPNAIFEIFAAAVLIILFPPADAHSAQQREGSRNSPADLRQDK
jgi:hypothetical protein